MNWKKWKWQDTFYSGGKLDDMVKDFFCNQKASGYSIAVTISDMVTGFL